MQLTHLVVAIVSSTDESVCVGGGGVGGGGVGGGGDDGGGVGVGAAVADVGGSGRPPSADIL